jgi:hypothetical protein
VLLARAGGLATTFRALSGQFSQLSGQVQQQVSDTVDAINSDSQSIARLNKLIRSHSSTDGSPPADLLSVYGSVQGQFANKNLDSSEKLYLGGPGGVRAYPVNEAGGSEGYFASLEARARLPMSVDLTGFFDIGSVRVNRDNDFTGAATPNRLTLKGVGVSAGWTAPFGLNLKATVAHRLGSNPNPTSTGRDQDGSLDMNRIWLQASLPF